MEQRWVVNGIRHICYDGSITDVLLTNIGISASCGLNGDYYQLLNKVRTNEASFGIQLYPLIQCHLKAMLLLSVKSEWNNAFKCARRLIFNYALKMNKLEPIHNDSKYYLGFSFGKYHVT